nr:alanine--tRNA ligase-related protein [uncultured Celeribacter sp.]
MTVPLFRDDPYLSEAEAYVIAHTTEGGVVLDCTIFYPEGGGQSGDSGRVSWAGQQIDCLTSAPMWPGRPGSGDWDGAKDWGRGRNV